MGKGTLIIRHVQKFLTEFFQPLTYQAITKLVIMNNVIWVQP